MLFSILIKHGALASYIERFIGCSPKISCGGGRSQNIVHGNFFNG